MHIGSPACLQCSAFQGITQERKAELFCFAPNPAVTPFLLLGGDLLVVSGNRETNGRKLQIRGQSACQYAKLPIPNPNVSVFADRALMEVIKNK